ncbi:la-related protein 7 [Monomorium pharaonis]|uniref:la-related protein 7 n=1 Tax=Monomorium pharaonis TaxID=307658 RepID=UPI001746C7A9|nr:la-related protein 7 [Monomorium pharaonis]XP_012532488.2 la-related protein 7 [Monomorium pharaonis]
MVMEESDVELASENIPVPQVQHPIVDRVKRNKTASRKPRLRKKALHASIRKQMEFYFSDSNLSKDRFLSKLLKENPYVDLEIFTRCNKLKELTTDEHMITTNRIAKALQGSTMLKVSEDGTKVCRITPIQTKENVDQCTIYVQNLPPEADHDWLISAFSKYGTVDYVSIPRYKSNKKIKGFAFVEFDTPSHAQECLKTFRKKGCVLPSHASPTELLSISTFEQSKNDTIIGVVDDSKAKKKLKENEEAFNEGIDSKDNLCEDIEDNNSKQSKKRKHSSEKLHVVDENDIKVKKEKKDIATQNIIDEVSQQDEKGKVLKAEFEVKDNACDTEIDATDNNDKQNFKRKKYSEKLPIIDECDSKIKKQKKEVHQSTTNRRNEKVLKEDSEGKKNICEIGAIDDKEDIKEEKYTQEKLLLESDTKAKKTADKTITDWQNEKEQVPREELEDKNIYSNEIDTADNQQNPKKRKISEKSYSKDERDKENTENQEKSRNKVTEKKKGRHTVNDTITVEDISGEAIRKEYQKPATSSNKNKTTELEHPFNEDENIETDVLSQTEKHSTRDFGTRSSDIEETDERKKKKNRKKRNKILGNDIYSKIGLQVMAKSDWKRLRNKYLDLQRHKMSQLKMHLRKAEGERGGIMTRWYQADWSVIHITRKSEHALDELIHENDDEKPNKEEKSCGRVNYAPGIIVKVEMDEPCTNVQSFKMELRDTSVKYIDVTADSFEAYVRFDSAEAAQVFTHKSYEGKRFTVLEGDEEKIYWEKIAKDRMEKLSRKGKVNQRGRTKLLKRAEKELGKCIKFDQD